MQWKDFDIQKIYMKGSFLKWITITNTFGKFANICPLPSSSFLDNVIKYGCVCMCMCMWVGVLIFKN